MKNNKLIKYKENVFIRIFNFFKRFFSSKNTSVSKNTIGESITDSKNKDNFLGKIQLKEKEEEIRLKKLQLLYDNGEIDEDDLSETDIEKLVALYEKETEDLNQDTFRRKIHIEQMLKELKKA